jgi:hypothetical protein
MQQQVSESSRKAAAQHFDIELRVEGSVAERLKAPVLVPSRESDWTSEAKTGRPVESECC